MGNGRRRSREQPDAESDKVRPEVRTEVRALDVDGVRTVAVLTIAWAIAFVVLAVRFDSLQAEGREWWLWTCLAGVGLGLLGLEYTRKRRDAIARAQAEAQNDDDTALVADDDAAQTDLPATPDPGVEPPQPLQARSSTDAITRPIDTGADLPPVTPPPPVVTPSPTVPPRPATPPSETRAGLRPDWASDLPPASGAPERPPPTPTPPIPAPPMPRTPPPRPRRPEPTFGDDTHREPARPDPGREPARREPVPERRPPAPGPERRAEREPRRQPSPESVRRIARSELLADADLPAAGQRPDVQHRPVDDEPLIDTLGTGRRARDYDIVEEIDEITEGGGHQYRGRRARGSDTA